MTPELKVITITNAREIVSRFPDTSFAVQQIRDKVRASGVLEMYTQSDAGGATYMICKNGDSLQLRLVDNTNEEHPTALAAIAIDPRELSPEQAKLIELAREQLKGVIEKFETALDAVGRSEEKITVIEIMQDAAGEINELMTQFVGHQIFKMNTDSGELEQEIKDSFDTWGKEFRRLSNL